MEPYNSLSDFQVFLMSDLLNGLNFGIICERCYLYFINRRAWGRAKKKTSRRFFPDGHLSKNMKKKSNRTSLRWWIVDRASTKKKRMLYLCFALAENVGLLFSQKRTKIFFFLFFRQTLLHFYFYFQIRIYVYVEHWTAVIKNLEWLLQKISVGEKQEKKKMVGREGRWIYVNKKLNSCSVKKSVVWKWFFFCG